jgi:hypothetical protein
MSEKDRANHWKELAEQLGIPDPIEPPERAESRVFERASETERERRLPAELRHEFGGERPAVAPVQTPRENPPPRRESPSPRRQVPDSESFPTSKSEQPPVRADLADGESPVEPTREERRERGGGRRRRSGKKSERRDSRRERAAAEADENRVRDDEQDEAPDDTPAPAPAVEDDEIDEGDDLSDWNMPSWQELIASLYRPDR